MQSVSFWKYRISFGFNALDFNERCQEQRSPWNANYTSMTMVIDFRESFVIIMNHSKLPPTDVDDLQHGISIFRSSIL